MIDFDGIRRVALSHLPLLLRRWLPDGRRVGREYVARNPTLVDRHAGSFKINLEIGCWADFATGDMGGRMAVWPDEAIEAWQKDIAEHGERVNTNARGART